MTSRILTTGKRLFKLNPSFLKSYKGKRPNFGFNGLGDITYRRTYSRLDHETGQKEEWNDTVERVIEGVFSMKRKHFLTEGCPVNEEIDQVNAQKMFDLVWNMKFLPPGRGLWAMGTPLIEDRGIHAALNNCAFVSTNNIKTETSKPFTFTMDALMLGVGVGFDTRGTRNNLTIHRPNPKKKRVFKVADTRESWVKATGKLIDSYLKPNQSTIVFDYSNIRAAGTPIKTFGGISAGPECLRGLHTSLDNLMNEYVGKKLDTMLIVDTMNLIGRCVVAGNVRRSSQIALGVPHDEVFRNLKNYDLYPKRAEWGWCSNNSIMADENTDYNLISGQIQVNGEPGILWLNNARNYGRMIDPPNYKDIRAMGVNPCGEQTLESYELCNLVEVFLNKHDNIDDFLNTTRYAFYYAKMVTLGQTHWKDTNEVMSRNRRIGVAVGSVSEFYTLHGRDKLIDFFDRGYKEIATLDHALSNYMKIPESIKTTTVKPSGTISLLAGSTPGIHASVGGEYHIRRIRFGDSDPNLTPIAKAGYNIEPDVKNVGTMVVDFPVKMKGHIKIEDHTTIEEQFDLAVLAQKYWSDNQVSCTVKFKEHEAVKIEKLLKTHQGSLKGISFLPSFESGKTAYAQSPYETISKETYQRIQSKIKPINWDYTDELYKDAVPDKYCSNDSCVI